MAAKLARNAAARRHAGDGRLGARRAWRSAYGCRRRRWWRRTRPTPLRYAFWFLFIGNLLQGGRSADGRPEPPRPAAAMGRRAGRDRHCSRDCCCPRSFRTSQMLGLPSQTAAFAVRLGLAVFGLVLVEQLMRRAHPQQRWGIKPLCVALAARLLLRPVSLRRSHAVTPASTSTSGRRAASPTRWSSR